MALAVSYTNESMQAQVKPNVFFNDVAFSRNWLKR